eukprot:gene11426-23898_t
MTNPGCFRNILFIVFLVFLNLPAGLSFHQRSCSKKVLSKYEYIKYLKVINNGGAVTKNHKCLDLVVNDLSEGQSEKEKERVTLAATISQVNVPEISQKGYVVLILCFLVTVLCALDRVAISVAIIPMAKELGYSESTKGLISSFFSLGYMTGLVPAGLLGTFSSPKLIMTIGVIIWSLGQILSPLAAFISIPALLVCRFGMGVAESVAIPLVQSFVARWVPDTRRSLVLSFILSGISVGNTIAYLASPAVLDAVQWSGLFLFYGSLGFVWLMLWLPLAVDSPTTDDISTRSGSTNTITGNSNNQQQIIIETSLMSDTTTQYEPDEAETFEILSPSAVDVIDEVSLSSKIDTAIGQLKSVPWSSFINSNACRAICVAHCVQNFGLYIILSWLPTYFNQRFDLSTQDSSFSSVLPWIAGTLCAAGAGVLSDKLVTNGVDKTTVRTRMQAFAFMFPALLLLILATNDNIVSSQAEIIFILSCGIQSVSAAGFGSSVQDICKSSKYTSIIYGITSVPAVLLGSTGVYLTGVIMEKYNNWDIVFGMTAVVYMFGAVFYSLTYRADKIFE